MVKWRRMQPGETWRPGYVYRYAGALTGGDRWITLRWDITQESPRLVGIHKSSLGVYSSEVDWMVPTAENPPAWDERPIYARDKLALVKAAIKQAVNGHN